MPRTASSSRNASLAQLVLIVVLLAVPVRGLNGQTSRSNPRSLIRLANEVKGEVARLRGLEFVREVSVRTIDPAQLDRRIREAIESELPPEKIHSNEIYLKHLGLLDPSIDLENLIVSMYSQHVAAFYDDEEKAFYFVLGPDEAVSEARMTAVHELTHALQDQHYDLARMKESVSEDDDALMGLESLVEGDACDVMLRYRLGATDRAGGQVRDYAGFIGASIGGASRPGLPFVIEQNMMFPYTYGSRFVAEILKHAGPDAVDVAFGNPPVSTEQIMNPLKYLYFDEPTAVIFPDVADLVPEDWSTLDKLTLGQFNLGVLLATHLGSMGVDEAVSGWDGDSLAGWVSPGAEVLVALYSVWDSPRDAAGFTAAVKRLVETRFEKLERVVDEDGLATWVRGKRLWYLRRRGRDVLLVENAPVAFAGELVMRLWESRKVPFGIRRPAADVGRTPFTARGAGKE